MQTYLESSTYIDWKTPNVLAKARQLAQGCDSDYGIAHACFLFVRDQIKHSMDFKLNPVTIKASEALEKGTGFCYAKSHLLAALLRANGIPAGLCYQRLTVKDDKPPFCLHGLNAVLLKDYGWYRMDARGNRSDIHAEFSPPIEQLAYPILIEGEADFAPIWATPMQEVTTSMEAASTYLELSKNLPDIEIIQREQASL
ncbi:Uncharacterised protein [BD1-7 clade bacterium]|uniref:Transglutaminase-like domain-containing protein n=1 Tax=BD1-7 clade bacterium TaxID=2029982 RepID=A0A5S9QY61_9GAMM|nr:Uncharacterised protein [BD1-7 clade bacterium]